MMTRRKTSIRDHEIPTTHKSSKKKNQLKENNDLFSYGEFTEPC